MPCPCRCMQMRLPVDLPPSMRGALISCDYFAKVKMKVRGGSKARAKVSSRSQVNVRCSLRSGSHLQGSRAASGHSVRWHEGGREHGQSGVACILAGESGLGGSTSCCSPRAASAPSTFCHACLLPLPFRLAPL